MKTPRWSSLPNFLLSHLRIAVAGTLISGAATMALFAASGPAARNLDVAGDGQTTSTSFVPRSARADSMVVVVQLSGKSVAETQADTGRKLTSSEKNQIKSQLKANQDASKPQIQAAGGKILAQFQSALNGIK